MKQTDTKTLRPLAGLALAIAVGAAFVPTERSYAQEAAATPAESSTLETMIVTGSALPQAEEYGPSPVHTLDTEAIERTGVTDILEVLRKSDPAFVGGNNLGQSNANISSNSTYGGSAISLRGLPTLVLIDGRRAADSSAAAAGGTVFTDVNLIPSALVERIEILKDGGSALYGSDAVGGVVNIILKKNFEGLEGGYHYGFAEEENKEGDLIADQKAWGIFGATTEKARVVAGVQYSEQDPIFTRDRQIGQPFYGTTSYGGVLVGDDYMRLKPGIITPTSLADYDVVTFDDILTGFDLSQNTTMTLEQRRFSVFANAEYDVLDNKALTVFANVIYSQNYNRSQLNAQPVNNFSGGGAVLDALLSEGAVGNFLGEDVENFSVRNRYTSHPRIYETDVDFYRFIGGLKGDLFDGNLHYEAAANISQNAIDFHNSNLLVESGLANAISSGQLNFFKPGQFATEDELAGVFGTDFLQLESNYEEFDLRLYGYPVTLPAGPLGLAGGFSYSDSGLKASVTPDIFLDATPLDAIDVSRYVTAVYGEVNMPLLGGDLTAPGIYKLNATFAFRAEHYEGTGDSGVPKFGLTYQPVKDVLFRASYSESFVAPTLYNLYGPSTTGFTDSGITLNGNPQDQAHASSGSNPLLEPEESTNWGVGVVITPRWVPGLTITVDYFNVDYSSVVGFVTDQTVLQSVEELGPASPYAQFVHQGSFTGPGVTAPGQLDGNLTDTYVVLNAQNLGGYKVEGFDWSAAYEIDLQKAGKLTLSAQGIYFTQYLFQALPTDPWVDIKGAETDATTGDYIPQWQLRSSLLYEWEGISFSFTFNYSPEVTNLTAFSTPDYPLFQGSAPKIDEYYTFDTQISYEFGKNKTYEPTTTTSYTKDGKEVVSNVTEVAPKKSLLDGLRLAVGVNNLFDQDAPFVENGTDNTDIGAFIDGVVGRYFYFEISKKF
ncbi:MAG TPA: TonB-dependent receptor [Chthoniobacterales bacterium]